MDLWSGIDFDKYNEKKEANSLPFLLQQNTDDATSAIVDHTLQGRLQFFSGMFRHSAKFSLDPFLH